MKTSTHVDQALIFSLFEDMIKYKINYGYRGLFTSTVSDGLIEFAQSIFNVSGISKKTKKRAFYILVECVQNITRHQDIPDTDKPESDGIFLIQSSGEQFNISQGNMIQSQQIKALEDKLEEVNRMESEGLDAFYRSKLRETAVTNKGGAGLGLIEIARKSGNKIHYKFRSIDDQFSFFFMDTLISESQADNMAPRVPFYGIDITEKLMSTLGDNGINLIYCSRFSDEGAFSLLDIIENLKLSKTQKSVVRKRIYTVLVELLQNISQHGADVDEFEGKTGILLMGTDGLKNKVITGNLISKEEEDIIAKRIDHINKLDRKGLDRLYVERLTDPDMSNPLKNGLGLVDMRIKSKNPIVYQFIPLTNEYSFFTIQVIIDN